MFLITTVRKRLLKSKFRSLVKDTQAIVRREDILPSSVSQFASGKVKFSTSASGTSVRIYNKEVAFLTNSKYVKAEDIFSVDSTPVLKALVTIVKDINRDVTRLKDRNEKDFHNSLATLVPNDGKKKLTNLLLKNAGLASLVAATFMFVTFPEEASSFVQEARESVKSLF